MLQSALPLQCLPCLGGRKVAGETFEASNPVRVFISYAWESVGYRRTVKALATRLRSDGVEARLDAWHLSGTTVPEFMNREVRHADKVLVVCSPSYRSKVHAMEDGRLTGVGWEAMLVNSNMFSGCIDRSFLEPVLLRGTWEESSPLFLRGLPYIDLSDIDDFEANYRHLLQKLTGHIESAPALGQLPFDLDPEPIDALRGPIQRSSIHESDHLVLPAGSKSRQLLKKTVAEESLDSLQQRFSAPISEHLENKGYFDQLHKGIKRLTDEQYVVIDFLRHVRRARISGSAGSGKTLVAAEKALRLSKAGFEVLFLCHNPQLASYIRTNLTAGSTVQVVDFCSWVRGAANADNSSLVSSWTHFDEPDDATLDQAASQIEKYDAIIVDEAQDFREKWWTVVEAGLKMEAFFYVFHDDNQSLLPRQGYPNVGPLIDLSKNCRNAQRVFDLMRCFARTLPESKLGGGRVILTTYVSGEERKAVTAVCRDLLLPGDRKEIVFIWAGAEPLDRCPIANCEIATPVAGPWQSEVKQQFERVLNTYDSRGMTMPSAEKIVAEMAHLSDEPYPTERDIERVQALAYSFGIPEDIRRRIRTSSKFRDRFHWMHTPKALKLWAPHTRQDPIWGAEIILKFQREDWNVGIPRPQTVCLKPYYESAQENIIPLYGVADFKGLEADIVVLVARGRTLAHKEMLYVGVSRARAMLIILADESAARVLPASFRWD